MRFKILSFLVITSSLCAAPGYFEPWGKDSDLKLPTAPERTSQSLSPLGWAAEQVILLHQNFLTKADGPRSHFRPTSARYMLLAVRRHGFFKGFMLGCDRLLRENDEKWVYKTVSVGGKTFKWDPVPLH